MNIVIIENHAHRLLSDGTIESAKITSQGVSHIGQAIIFGEWKSLDPVGELEMGYDEFDLIRKQLEQLNYYFPEGRSKLPKSEKQENVGIAVHPV